IIPDGAAAQRQPRFPRFAQQRQVDPEAAVGGLGPRDRLEYQVDRKALPDQSERGGHMREDAALRRYLQPRNDAVEQPQQFANHPGIVAGGVDADTSIARSQQQAVEDRSGDALDVIEGMVRLQPHAHPPAQADRVAKAGSYLAL